MILAFIGTTELILLGGLALLLFGGKKLPEMMRGLGKGVKEFKEGMKEDPQPESDVDENEQSINEQDAENPKSHEKVEIKENKEKTE